LGFSEQFFDRNVNRFIGFNVQIPIFDNLNRRTSLQNSKITLKNSQLEMENIRFQVNEEVRQAYNDYMSIVKELDSTEKALTAAERAYETEFQRYEVGASTLIELNQANANYVQAQSNRIQTIYNFVFQEKLLDFYLGQLTASMEF
jgi:outer membrane protein